MARPKKKKEFHWDIKPEEIEDKKVAGKYSHMWRKAKATHDLRTKNHKVFSRISHMQPLFDGDKKSEFSEGSTQAIKRKLRAETIQRVPDGEIRTQFDKNSIEQVEIEYIFKNKILRSEFSGKDMLKNLWNAWNESYDYGYACVRTGFEDDVDGDLRTTFKLIHWNDVYPAPDCDFIESANWYIVREYLSRSDLKNLIDWNTGHVKDSSYEEKTIQYLIETHIHSGQEPNSQPLQDAKNHVTKNESIEIRTIYRRGADEFVTYVPSVNAILRTSKNYDPRKDVPLHFMILEPDPDFPLGMSSILPTLSQQQFADAFQTLSYQTLLLAAQPPLMGFGNLTPAKIKMKPRAYWPMGTNPNNKIEKFPVETTTLTQYGSILQNVSASMMKNMNATESTVASDAYAMNYSGTPQGVEQQKADRTITVNQYRKRVEIFFSEWAEHALRSYLASMSGEQEMTVDEETRRRIWDIEKALAPTDPATGEPLVMSIINENKIMIDFSALSADMLEFDVRAGSLVQSENEKELENIQQMLVPISQMMGNVSDQNKAVFEQSLLDLTSRLFELSNIDISQTNANRISDQLMMDIMQATMQQIDAQNQQIQQQQQQIAGMQNQMGISPEQAIQQGAPMPEQGMPQEMVSPGEMPVEEAGIAPDEVSAEFPQQEVPAI